MDKYRFNQLLESTMGNVKPLLSESDSQELSSVEQNLINLANAERFLVDWGKPSNPDNTDEVTYTDLSDMSVKDDFTIHYDRMIEYLNENDNEVTLFDNYNYKKFRFELDGDKLIITKL
jgi:hypothetical protein